MNATQRVIQRGGMLAALIQSGRLTKQEADRIAGLVEAARAVTPSRSALNASSDPWGVNVPLGTARALAASLDALGSLS